jgi:hypothetical protein
MSVTLEPDKKNPVQGTDPQPDTSAPLPCVPSLAQRLLLERTFLGTSSFWKKPAVKNPRPAPSENKLTDIKKVKSAPPLPDAPG